MLTNQTNQNFSQVELQNSAERRCHIVSIRHYRGSAGNTAMPAVPGAPIAMTPCRIPLEQWGTCYADECYLNGKCPSYAGTKPRFDRLYDPPQPFDLLQITNFPWLEELLEPPALSSERIVQLFVEDIRQDLDSEIDPIALPAA